ncbi:MAG TPA: hypothetical protein PK047_12965 [Saprospiraceae bacterium]|nr:hypothetical protein [Saprospiraceae bacterium]HRO09770.1 hypothetical protein [Saprospiraceae bacterium]HRP42936.1 hypothetical protein [Saprospiraceae bacterium]
MNKKIQFELLSVLFAIVLCGLFVLPVFYRTGSNYLFYIPNIFAIIVFITFMRWIFMLKYSPFARNNVFRFVMIFLCIPLFIYQLDSLMEFTGYMDEHGLTRFFKDPLDMDNYAFSKYIKVQFLFFSTSSLITIILLPVRMIRSFWRTINTKHGV